MIRTVLGDLRPSLLGSTDYHEHAFQSSPLLPGEDLDDAVRSCREFQELRDSGFSAVIDATPIGLGRRPSALAQISRRTGLQIVATTGAHRGAHYPESHELLQADETALAAMFLADLVEGMSEPGGGQPHDTAPTAPRAGLVKAGIDYWCITAFERRVLAAAANAHAATNAPIMIHLERGTAAFEVLEILSADGVPPDAVVLAHMDRNPDPVLHADLATAGAYLGYDGFARAKDWPDSLLIDCLIRTAEAGGAERILLGGDVARRSRYRAYGGLPGLRYLGDRVLPRIRAVAPDLLALVLTSNPARFLNRFELRGPEG